MFFERKIKMRPDEAKDFVAAASKCDFDIDIFYNHYNSVLTIRYSGFNEEFENYLKGFALAC